MAGERAKTKIKKKKWFPIRAPELFDNKKLGESYCSEESELVGKTVTQSVMNITGNMKKQNIRITFKVTKVEDGEGITKITGYHISGSSLKRIVGKGRDRIDDSFIAKFKNGELCRVKPVIITNTKNSKPVQTELRKSMKKKMRNLISSTSFNSLAKELLKIKIQKRLKNKLSKITSLRRIDIRSLKLLPEEKQDEKQVEKVEEKQEGEQEEKEEEKEEVSEESEEEKSSGEEPSEEDTVEEEDQKKAESGKTEKEEEKEGSEEEKEKKEKE